MTPLAIFAGLPETGGDRLAALFEANGFSTTRRIAGKLADNLAYHRLENAPVRALLGGYDLVVGPASRARPGRPFLTEFQELDHLRNSFPDAVLVFTEIDEREWLQRLLFHDDGAVAAFQADWLGISQGDLPAFWLERLARQRERLAAAQDQGTSVIFLQTSGDFAEWQKGLLPWFSLPVTPNNETTTIHTIRPRRNDPAPAVPPVLALGLTSMLARHCLGTLQNEVNGRAEFSAIYTEWDGRQTVTDQDGAAHPIRFGQLGGRPRCLAKPGVKKMNRVEGVINEALSIGATRPLRIDMQDCRLYGLEEGDIPATPILTYCRRASAKNVVLWPLPEYHSIGAENFVGGETDEVPFENKLDVLFWRGAISGHCSDVTEGIFENEVWRVANALSAEPDREDLWAQFSTCTRVAVVERYSDTEGTDMRFVSGPSFDWLSTYPRSAHLCGRPTSRRMMLRHRYILSMRGYDTGSNFISAANSNSVVLKEEDGWELFYSPLFRPWESYIPLAPGLHNLEERLDWARRNPTRCKAISAAARKACAYLALPKWRRLLLRTIADSI